jgi:hypothetical protein
LDCVEFREPFIYNADGLHPGERVTRLKMIENIGQIIDSTGTDLVKSWFRDLAVPPPISALRANNIFPIEI